MKTPKEKPQPNIAFTGAKTGREPLRQIINGDHVIKLPKNQKQPFYHKDAKTIARLYGWLYKPLTPKG